MSSSPGLAKLLPRGRSPHGPTKTAWTTRCDHLQPRGDSAGRTRSRRHKARHKPRTPSGTGDINNVPVINASRFSTRPKSSFTWEDISEWKNHQEPKIEETPESRSESDDDIPKETTPPPDPPDDRCAAVEEKTKELHYDEPDDKTSVESKSNVEKVPLRRQPSCDSLFTGKHLKPAGVWRPYGPPLYGYGSALNPPRRKGPDTLVILAAIFYCLAALTAVVLAVLFKTNVLSCEYRS
ncbi:uncharacterized protein LOC144877715 [Branchiostoma floridae x Branchiostoma japonicum]